MESVADGCIPEKTEPDQCTEQAQVPHIRSELQLPFSPILHDPVVIDQDKSLGHKQGI